MDPGWDILQVQKVNNPTISQNPFTCLFFFQKRWKWTWCLAIHCQREEIQRLKQRHLVALPAEPPFFSIRASRRPGHESRSRGCRQLVHCAITVRGLVVDLWWTRYHQGQAGCWRQKVEKSFNRVAWGHWHLLIMASFANQGRVLGSAQPCQK